MNKLKKISRWILVFPIALLSFPFVGFLTEAIGKFLLGGRGYQNIDNDIDILGSLLTDKIIVLVVAPSVAIFVSIYLGLIIAPKWKKYVAIIVSILITILMINALIESRNLLLEEGVSIWLGLLKIMSCIVTAGITIYHVSIKGDNFYIKGMGDED